MPDPARPGASLSDILTTAQNMVVAINNVATTYLTVQGKSNVADISVPTVVKSSPGRLVRVSVTQTGNVTGAIYDNTVGNSTLRTLYVIPTTLGVEEVNIPANYGISVIPGAGQVVTVSFS